MTALVLASRRSDELQHFLRWITEWIWRHQREIMITMFGLAAQGQILALANAVLKADSERVLRELNELSKDGKDLGRLLADLLGKVALDPE